MPRLMRCKYCGTLQDEPPGAKVCVQCGGELSFEDEPAQRDGSYVRGQLELDQIAAPAGQVVERYLVLTVETPDAVPPSEQVHAISGPGPTTRLPMNFVAVLDVSGSMRGSAGRTTRIEAAKEAIRQAVQRLQDGDFFALVTFATDVRCPLPPRRVDAGFRRVIESSLREIEAGGQTALRGGLEFGIKQVGKHARLAGVQSTSLVLLLSDGQANVGETDVEMVGRRALDARAKGVTVSTLGVGSQYNEVLMAEIATEGGGRFYHIADAGQVAAYLTGELGEMTSLAARNATVALHVPAGTDVQPLSMAYPVHGHVITLGDIPLATTLEVIVRVLLPPQPAGSRLPMDGVLRYQSPAGNTLTTPLNVVTVRYDKAALFEHAAGMVKPVVWRVLGQMQAAGVLSTARAATHGAEKARRQSSIELVSMRKYASLLGPEDREARKVLSESEGVLQEIVAAHSGGQLSSLPNLRAKEATYAAMRRQRGSKEFGKA